MSDLIRFGVSIENDLLESFDKMTAGRGYATRSEALRDLMRDALVQSRLEAKPDTEVLGSLTLIYDHHSSDLAEQMAERQHNHHDLVISVLHVHVNHDDCMEVIALRGTAHEITKLADALLSLKGVKHGKLFITLPSRAVSVRSGVRKNHQPHSHDKPVSSRAGR